MAAQAGRRCRARRVFSPSEAPAICKKDGKYYRITSGCTGWAPNAARSFVASSVWGPWQPLANPAAGRHHLQLAEYLHPARSRPKDAFIFMADRWTPKNPIDGGYVWLPLCFEGDQPRLAWAARRDFSAFDQPKASAAPTP